MVYLNFGLQALLLLLEYNFNIRQARQSKKKTDDEEPLGQGKTSLALLIR